MYLQKEPEKANLFSMNLGYLSQFFENSQFHRLSRSLVVNLHQIERVEKAQIFFSGISKPIEYPENKHTELLKKLQVIKTA
jgi:DNA-binding LytR/AlgR family response regulator